MKIVMEEGRGMIERKQRKREKIIILCRWF